MQGFKWLRTSICGCAFFVCMLYVGTATAQSSLLSGFGHGSKTKPKPAPPTSCDQPSTLVDSAEDLAALGKLGCTSMAGDLVIRGRGVGASDLSALDGLQEIEGSLTIRGIPTLASLRGLGHLQKIKGSLFLGGTDRLASLDGLAGLESVGGDLTIAYEATLGALDGLGSLQAVGGNFTLVGDFKLASLHGAKGLKEVGGVVHLAYLPALSSLTGMPLLESVGGLRIEGLQALATLGRFGKPAAIHGALEVVDNPNLATVTKEAGPSKVEGTVHIAHNGGLDKCAVDALLEQSGRAASEQRVTLEDVSSECGGQR